MRRFTATILDKAPNMIEVAMNIALNRWGDTGAGGEAAASNGEAKAGATS